MNVYTVWLNSVHNWRMTESWSANHVSIVFRIFFHKKGKFSVSSCVRHLDVQGRTDDMTGCLFKGGILANKLETNLYFVMRLGNSELNCKICASTNPSDYMKSENAENKLVWFSNPATNVYTTAQKNNTHGNEEEILEGSPCSHDFFS